VNDFNVEENKSENGYNAEENENDSDSVWNTKVKIG
jgi:hypothetical protein